MFIDYVTLLLLNMTAGLIVLAGFVIGGLHHPGAKQWCPPLLVVGAVAVAGGLHVSLTWPLPGPYNMIFGEMSVMLGALWLGAALAIGRGWSLMPLTLVAVPAGLAAILLGAGLSSYGLTQKPWLSAVGFVLTGLTGVLSPVVVYLRRYGWVRGFAAGLVLLAAAVWAVTAGGAYWAHLDPEGNVATWAPVFMRGP